MPVLLRQLVWRRGGQPPGAQEPCAHPERASFDVVGLSTIANANECRRGKKCSEGRRSAAFVFTASISTTVEDESDVRVVVARITSSLGDQAIWRSPDQAVSGNRYREPSVTGSGAPGLVCTARYFTLFRANYLPAWNISRRRSYPDHPRPAGGALCIPVLRSLAQRASRARRA